MTIKSYHHHVVSYELLNPACIIMAMHVGEDTICFLPLLFPAALSDMSQQPVRESRLHRKGHKHDTFAQRRRWEERRRSEEEEF